MPVNEHGDTAELAARAIKLLRGQHEAFMTVVDRWPAETDVGQIRHVDGGLEVKCLDEIFRAPPRWVTHEGTLHATEYALRSAREPESEPVWVFYLRGDVISATPNAAAVIVTTGHGVTQKTMLYKLAAVLLASGRFLPCAPTR